jgi:hypothetical protein
MTATRRNRAVKTPGSPPAPSVLTPTLGLAETLGSSGGYTPPEDLQASALSDSRKKWNHGWGATRVATRRNRAVKTPVSPPTHSVLTTTLGLAETLGSSGGYTPPEDLQVSAQSDCRKKWNHGWGATRVATRQNRAVQSVSLVPSRRDICNNP